MNGRSKTVGDSKNASYPGSLHRFERSVAVRISMVIALTITLAAAFRWAMNVTNANAKQVAGNITRLEENFQTVSGTQKGGQILSPSGSTDAMHSPEDPADKFGPSIGPVSSGH